MLDVHTVRRIAGELEDSVVAAIVATGIDEAGLREASLRVIEGEEQPSLESGGDPVVRQVVQILERVAVEEAEQFEDVDSEVDLA